jgi:hypothetical protein
MLEAQAMADFRNVHFRAEGSEPWEAAHFFGKPYGERSLVPTVEEILKYRAYKVKPRQELPDWAKGSKS